MNVLSVCEVPSEARFLDVVCANRVNAELLRRLPALALPQGHLTAGCLFQALWNLRSGQAPDWGVKDYDLFYHDAADLSFEAEDAVIRRVQAAVADLGVNVEVRNQARVHLWYERRFGIPYPPLRDCREGIDRYLVACTCVGLALDSGRLYAPDGLGDLAAGRLRLNPRWPQPALFAAKAASYRARWPWLTVCPAPSPAAATSRGAGQEAGA